MTSTLSTSDALTTLDLPKKFDVTKFPREVEQYLEHTDNPFHRVILKNYFRHLLLEISGYWDQILVPELTAGDFNQLSVRSYGLTLLGWLRFLDAADVAWDRAGRAEARDFVLWMREESAGRSHGLGAPLREGVNLRTGKPYPGERSPRRRSTT